MTLSMYQTSAPRFVAMLNNLSAILDKGKAYAESKKIEATVLTSDRLFPDMFTLARQVQIACDSAKGAMARLAGVEIPKHEDTEQTFDELKARIARTIAFVETLKPAHIDGSEDREIVLKAGGTEVKFKGANYLLDYALPNLYFHVTTAYNILRHNGVDVGKWDYLGRL